MYYYQFNPGDYLRDTAHLEPLEDLAYRRLLDLYYDQEGPISLETDWVSRRIRLGSDVVARVLEEFFERTEKGWKMARCDAEIANYKAKADRARKNGKLGGRPKKTDRVISRNPEKTGSKANHKPLTNNQSTTPLIPQGGNLPFDSDRFKQAWQDWTQHRKEARKKMTPSTERSQLRKLEKLGEDRAIATIRNSIEGGYQGLYEPKNGRATASNGQEYQAGTKGFFSDD